MGRVASYRSYVLGGQDSERDECGFLLSSDVALNIHVAGEGSKLESTLKFSRTYGLNILLLLLQSVV